MSQIAMESSHKTAKRLSDYPSISRPPIKSKERTININFTYLEVEVSKQCKSRSLALDYTKGRHEGGLIESTMPSSKFAASNHVQEWFFAEKQRRSYPSKGHRE